MSVRSAPDRAAAMPAEEGEERVRRVVLERVNGEFKTSQERLLGKTRTDADASARHAAGWLHRAFTGAGCRIICARSSCSARGGG